MKKNLWHIFLMMLAVLFLSKETTLAAGNAVSSAAGEAHSLILKSDGTVWAWGANNHGQLGDGTTVQKNVPVQVKGITNIMRIAAGSNHSIALKADGTVWAWGYNSDGALGNGTFSPYSNTPVQAVGLTDVAEIAAGGNHGLALKKDGTVWMWGIIPGKSKNIPFKVEGLTEVKAIASGVDHCLAVKKDGTVWAWGWNSSGQLGINNMIDTVVPTQTNGLSNIVSVAAGFSHSLALDVNGKVYVWGSGSSGQIGDGSYSEKFVPVNIPELTDIEQIASGPSAYHSIALKRDGTVYAWGSNSQGQLGDGTISSSARPVKITFTP
ncbi:RCC1 domain-containing protein [Brevibacillus porteri]|uniref:RCC1 domain-containing protein n=1 Tax=Brevibacillus porteri TaxID=2126350 RepID=UPI003D223B17